MKPCLPIALLAALALTACADNSPGGKAVQARHDRFHEIGKAFKGIDEQLKENAPDFAVIHADAAKIAGLAPGVTEWFPAGSGPQDGKRTDAKAEIWTRPAEFQQAASHFVDAAAMLKAAAEAGNVADTGARAKAVGAACKGCHDKFRED